MDVNLPIDQNTLIIAVVAIVVLYLLFKVASKILKFVGILIAIGLGYYFWTGGTVDGLKEELVQALFKEGDVTQMVDKYCAGDKSDSFKCNCIVQPVYADLSSRLSQEELVALSGNEEERIKQIRQSLRNKSSDIKNCIVKEKGGQYWDKVKGAVDLLKKKEE